MRKLPQQHHENDDKLKGQVERDGVAGWGNYLLSDSIDFSG